MYLSFFLLYFIIIVVVSVTLQCTKEGLFIVVVARDATLPNIDLETISFHENGHSCNPVGSTSAFAIYEFPVTACGTVVKVSVVTELIIMILLILLLLLLLIVIMKNVFI